MKDLKSRTEEVMAITRENLTKVIATGESIMESYGSTNRRLEQMSKKELRNRHMVAAFSKNN